MRERKKLFVGLFVSVMFVATSAFAASLSIPDMSGEKGTTVEIPVDIENAAGVAGFQMTVNYDPAVLNCTQATTGDLTGGWSVTAKTEKGKVNIGGFSPALSELSGGGSLAKLTCTVIGELEKKTEVKISSKKLSDSKGAEIKSLVSGSSVFKVKKGKKK